MVSIKFKKLILLTSKLLIAIVILWFLIHSAQLKPELFAHLFLHPFLTFEIVAILFSLILVGAWRWHILNALQGIHLSPAETISATYLGAAFNYILPSSVGGDVVRMYYAIKKNPLKKSLAMLSVFFDRAIGLLAVFVMICIISLIRLDTFKQYPQLLYLVSTCTFFCLGALFIFSILIFLREKISIAKWLNSRFPDNKLIKPFIAFFDAINKFRLTTSAVTKCLLISIINQLLLVCCVFIIAKIMGLPAISFADYALAMSITQIVNLIPLTPGGVGIGEMAFAHILQLLNPGVTGAFATIFFTYRILSILTYLPGFIVYIPQFIALKQRDKLELEQTVTET